MQLQRWRSALAVAVLAAGVSAPWASAQAQEVRGVVRDSMSQQPIPGAVLIFSDSTGATLGRNITNERGEYRAVWHPAMRRMHVLRIGFRPRDVAIPSAEKANVTLDVTMTMIPHLLEATYVVDNPNCSRRDDRAPAFALWEQARAALLATVVARETNPPRVVRYRFDRTMDRDGKRAISQNVLVDTADTDQPFVSAESAASFVDRGFRDDSAGMAIFHGPDADVLLDDAFERGYCFGIADAEAGRPGQVGLSFGAAKHRRDRIDITGAVWIDTTSRTLVDLVWRYEGLGRQLDRYDPSGRVSFRTMPNGSAMIDSWSIRVVGGARTATINGPVTIRGSVQVHETGGELADARWADGQAWHASLATLQGIARLHGAPATGQRIRLVDTPYEATVDSAGRFSISDLVPGPYQIGVVDSSLMAIGLLLTSNQHFVAVRDSTTQIGFEIATPDAFAAMTCRDDPTGPSNPVLVGRVRLPNGSPAVDARIDVRVDESGSLRVVSEGKADARGLFDVCHVPRNTTLFIRAQLDGYDAGTGLILVERAVSTIDLRLKPMAAR